jgi:hypothetical protein
MMTIMRMRSAILTIAYSISLLLARIFSGALARPLIPKISPHHVDYEKKRCRKVGGIEADLMLLLLLTSMGFTSCLPTFVGLVHLPRIGPTFFNCIFWAEYSPAYFPGSLASPPLCFRKLLHQKSPLRFADHICNFSGLADKLESPTDEYRLPGSLSKFLNLLSIPQSSRVNTPSNSAPFMGGIKEVPPAASRSLSYW